MPSSKAITGITSAMSVVDSRSGPRELGHKKQTCKGKRVAVVSTDGVPFSRPIERKHLVLTVPRNVWSHRQRGGDVIVLRIECAPHVDLVHYRFVGESCPNLIRARHFLECFERKLSEVA